MLKRLSEADALEAPLDGSFRIASREKRGQGDRCQLSQISQKGSTHPAIQGIIPYSWSIPENDVRMAHGGNIRNFQTGDNLMTQQQLKERIEETLGVELDLETGKFENRAQLIYRTSQGSVVFWVSISKREREWVWSGLGSGSGEVFAELHALNEVPEPVAAST